MLVHNSNHMLHDGKMNECAARVQAVRDELQMRGLWERCELWDLACSDEDPPNDDTQSSATTAAAALHTAAHLAALRTGFACAPKWNCTVCTFGNNRNETSCQVCGAERSAASGATVDFVIPEGKSDVYLCRESLDVALANCHGCCQAARQLVDDSGHDDNNPRDDVSSVFCLVRPPGHHASSETFGSYCLINTIAVVAKALVSSASSACKKVLIVDWDVHHGDGTQTLVEHDPLLQESCCFVSIHRHDKGFWPKSGAVHEGETSRIVNVPLQGIGYADADYYYIFCEVILPLARKFEPDVILVSAGYDCAQGDQLGRFAVTSQAFGHLSRMLLGIAPAAFILEGGYDVDGSTERPHGPLRDGAAATIESLLLRAASTATTPGSSTGNRYDEDTMFSTALPEGWCESVRDETKQVVCQVRERLDTS